MFSKELNKKLDRYHLLTHPFYQVFWNEGKLTREIIKDYAEQYYQHVKAFPRYISATHSICEDLDKRKIKLSVKAAQIDGASGFRIYRRIIIPMLRPAFLSAFVILAHLSIKAYDLVIALTNGGPGRATEVPATFMYSYTFSRNQMGVGATTAIIMLLMIFSIIIPYLYSELRSEKQS